MSRYIQADLSQCKYTIIGVTDRLIDQGQTPRLLHKVYQKKGKDHFTWGFFLCSLQIEYFYVDFLLHWLEVEEIEWDTLQVTCVLSGGLFLSPALYPWAKFDLNIIL